MNKFSKEFINLIKDNPDLPVYAYVDGDICCGYDFRWYLGEFGYSQLATILISDEFERVYDDKEEFKEDYCDRYYDEFADLTDEEIEQTLNSVCESQPWENCILVYVGAVLEGRLHAPRIRDAISIANQVISWEK